MLRRVLVLASYVLMGLVIVIGTLILVELGQGYGYDFSTGQFYLNGILALGSSPNGATLSINGHPTNRHTPYHSTLKTGSYSLELQKAGYLTWTKQVTLAPFHFLNYSDIFFVPSVISRTNVTPKQAATNLVASDDRRHFAFISPAPNQAVWVVNPDSRQSTKVYTPAAATADTPAEAVEAISWSKDASHILVQSLLAGTQTYSVVSAGGGTPVNLTELFKFDLTGLRFSSYDWQELFWNSADGLRKINIANKTASSILADQVKAFTFAGDRVIYVQSGLLGESVWSMDKAGNNRKQLLDSIAASDSYTLKYANYSGRDLLAILPAQSATLTVYLDIFSSNPISKVVAHGAGDLSFSDSGQYLAFDSASSFGTYDFDTDSLYTTKEAGLSALTWFDKQHVLLSRGSEADLVELDGDNRTDITPLVAGTVAYASPDQRFVYTVETIGVTTAIVSSSLRP